MPFLRFSRDKRGYETTSLVHAGRRQGRSRQRILYWFRTPPGVKVGRPALDETAIRWIEENNPDIEFDWPKILEAKPLPAPSDDQRQRRRRDKPDRRRAATPQAVRPLVPPPGEPTVNPEESIPEEELVEALQQLAQSTGEPDVDVPSSPIEHAVGKQDLTRLRARYAELLMRITERGGDATRVESLRAEAEALNPDRWVTEEETRKGLAEFEAKLRDLRAALGLRRRHRSRRGGRRRHGRQGSEASPTPDPE
ncbi:MAG TPA: hypothetical protein VJM31_07920 [Vicinamibacterales bacterium]|nr:hypothetical protein [Vicinamibacterales bacterium]